MRFFSSGHILYFQSQLYGIRLDLNNRYEIKDDSSVIVKIKKKNLNYFNSVILSDPLEFLFVFKIFDS